MPPPADLPEQRAREQIDAMLAAAGWAVQHRSAMNLAAAPGVAIRELRTEAARPTTARAACCSSSTAATSAARR